MAMQKLNVRFSDEVKSEISKMANLYSSNESDLARAAMVVGLEWLDQKSGNIPKCRMGELISANQKLIDPMYK